MKDILLPIGIAILSPILTTILAARKFKKEQKWQMKAESVKQLCEVLDRMILNGESWEKELEDQYHLLKETENWITQLRTDLIELKTQVSIVDILFNWDFSIVIDRLVKKLEREYRESVRENNPFEFSYIWQNEIKKLRDSFVLKAQKALK